MESGIHAAKNLVEVEEGRRVEGKMKRTLCPLPVDQRQERETSGIGLCEVIDQLANDEEGGTAFQCILKTPPSGTSNV